MYLVCAKAQRAKAREGIGIQGKGFPIPWVGNFVFKPLKSHFQTLFNSFVVIKTIQSSK